MMRLTILLSIILLIVSCEKEENQFLTIGENNAVRLQEYATQNKITKVAIFESYDQDIFGWHWMYEPEKFEFSIEKSFLILKNSFNNDIIYDLSKMVKFDHISNTDFLNIYFLK